MLDNSKFPDSVKFELSFSLEIAAFLKALPQTKSSHWSLSLSSINFSWIALCWGITATSSDDMVTALSVKNIAWTLASDSSLAKTASLCKKFN